MTSNSPVSLGREEARVEQLRTNYLLAHELAETMAWIASHALRIGEDKPHLDRLARVVAHLRGGRTERPNSIDELLRNDPWAAAIANHVRAADRSASSVLEKAPTFTAEDVELLDRCADGCDGTLNADPEDWVFPDGIRLRMKDVDRFRAIAKKVNSLCPPTDSPRTTT